MDRIEKAIKYCKDHDIDKPKILELQLAAQSKFHGNFKCSAKTFHFIKKINNRFKNGFNGHELIAIALSY